METIRTSGKNKWHTHRGVHGMVILHELLFVVLGILEQRVGHGRAEVGFHRLL